jgi:hypothetical protein
MQNSSCGAVEHAETLQTICNVSTKQQFGLKKVAGGHKLVFRLDCLPHACPTRVQVMVGVKIVYREAVGLRVLPSDPENEQFVVLEQKRFNSHVDIDIARMAAINMDKLSPCSNAGDLQAPRSLLACPIAIVVESDVFYDAGDGTGSSTGGEADDEERPTVHKHIQYTFLDFKKEAIKKAAASAASSHSGGGATADGSHADLEMTTVASGVGGSVGGEPLVPLTLLKQLLDVDGEVFELDDVYDLGGDVRPTAPPQPARRGEEESGGAAGDDPGEGTSPAAVAGTNTAAAAAFDDVVVEDVCVVCLCNPKDTTILPCRHMCLCADCAGQLRNATNKCPICRQQIGKLLTFNA